MEILRTLNEVLVRGRWPRNTRAPRPPDLDVLYTAYNAAPSDKEAFRILFEGMTAQMEAQRASLHWWHRWLIALGLLAFAWFVWPTPFVYYMGPRREVLIKVNRITGHAQYVVPELAK